MNSFSYLERGIARDCGAGHLTRLARVLDADAALRPSSGRATVLRSKSWPHDSPLLPEPEPRADQPLAELIGRLRWAPARLPRCARPALRGRLRLAARPASTPLRPAAASPPRVLSPREVAAVSGDARGAGQLVLTSSPLRASQGDLVSARVPALCGPPPWPRCRLCGRWHARLLPAPSIVRRAWSRRVRGRPRLRSSPRCASQIADAVRARRGRGRFLLRQPGLHAYQFRSGRRTLMVFRGSVMKATLRPRWRPQLASASSLREEIARA